MGLLFSNWFMAKRRGVPDGEGDAEGYKPLTDAEMDAELDRTDENRYKE